MNYYRKFLGLAISALSILAIAVAIVMVKRSTDQEPPTKLDTQPTITATDGISGANPYKYAQAELPRSSGASSSPAPKPEGTLTEFNALSASTSAPDRYKAYKILANCHRLVNLQSSAANLSRENENSQLYSQIEQEVQRLKQSCVGLPYYDNLRRFNLVRDAARHGIPEAVIDLYDAGPNGNIEDINTRPTDPTVKEWFDEATALLQGLAKTGDKQATYKLLTIYSIAAPQYQDLTLALQYSMLALAIENRESPPKKHRLRALETQIQNLKSMMTSDQISAAEQGAALFLVK